MATPVEQDIIRLDVSMNELQLVDCFDGHDDLGYVEPRDILAEEIVLHQHRHKVAPWEELHQHVQESDILERRIQPHHPRAVGLSEDVPFGTDSGDLLSCYHLRFDETLQGIDLPVGLLAYQLDLAKCALPDQLDGFIIIGLVAGPEEP